MTRKLTGTLAGLIATALMFGAGTAQAQVTAGAAKVDASWHVGAAAGQYAGDCLTDGAEETQGSLEDGDPAGAAEATAEHACAFGVDPSDGTYDPTAHSTRRENSYGLQSRLDVRALVIDGGEGAPVAIVKTNQYVPQDLLYRRAAQILEQRALTQEATGGTADCPVTRETLTMTATHNHSSPMYSSTSWGVWAFQDVFDVRFYNYLAERIAEAVVKACAAREPVRVGASVGSFDKTHRHSFGPAVADDGTPAGYPNDETDHDLTVIRFDTLDGKPLANLVNFSLHPEFLEGNDLLSGDYVAPLERMTDRATGALTVYTQGAVGTAEPERSTYHSLHERLEFTHRDYAQAEYGASLMSKKVVDVWRDVEAGTPDDPERFVPFASDVPVQMSDRWFPGPFSHPYPGVSNCRTDSVLGDAAGVPIAGLPDCQRLPGGLSSFSDALGLPDVPPADQDGDPGLTTDDFQELGIPVPENYSAPAYTGLEEDIDIHLQGIRLGEIYLPICSCEQWFDQSKNIETRTNTVAGDEWLGYDWGARCTKRGDGTYRPYDEPGASGTGTWDCPNPGDPAQTLPPVSDHELRRMRAQVLNPANGWNDAENVLTAESEPTEVTEIKGNFSHDDDDTSAALGYTLTVPISMANDYNGYIASYREYQRGDHYRKALTGWGPHSSDYMASRLVTLGRQLKDADVELPTDQVQEQALAAKAEADQAINDVRAQALGDAGTAAIEAYEAALPDDGGEAGATEDGQPEDVERFDATFFTWVGGSNYTDDPEVQVLRRTADGWEQWADQSGELPVTVEFPSGLESAPGYAAGQQEWRWTAHFEAFVAPFDVGRPERATPAGTYKFVVAGERREGGAVVPYEIESKTFEVLPWDGITVSDLRADPGGTVSFAATGPEPSAEGATGSVDYPDSYAGDPRAAQFIRDERTTLTARGESETFCFTCSFRPWLDSGEAARARVTFVGAGGEAEDVAATRQGDRWVTERALGEGESAFVGAGCVEDEYGNFNGAGSVTAVGAAAEPPAATEACFGDPPTEEPPPADPPPGDPPPGDPPPGDTGGDGTLPNAGDDGAAGPLPGPGTVPPACTRGTRRDERLEGTAGDDCIAGGRGDDRISGKGGDDRLTGGPGNDVIAGGAGADEIACGPGKGDVARADRADTVTGCEKVRGRG
ncbi:MAG TPA: hypothetical protein VFY99_09795 [Solirubrobacterales bacterium]